MPFPNSGCPDSQMTWTNKTGATKKTSYFPLYWLAFMFVPSHVWTLHQWVGPHLRCLKKLWWENCTTPSAPRRLVGTWAKGKAGTAVYDLVVFQSYRLNRFVSSQKAKPQEVFFSCPNTWPERLGQPLTKSKRNYPPMFPLWYSLS